MVVVCGKNVVKFVVKLKNCWIGTKIGVVVDIDTPIMIVVCGSSNIKWTYFGKKVSSFIMYLSCCTSLFRLGEVLCKSFFHKVWPL